MKILIVDNDEAIRRLLAGIVGCLSPEVIECADGADALAAYETHRPDVVLMDIAMPLVDGISATATITTAYPDARVVIVSNYDDPDLRDSAAQAGAVGYVPKEDLLDLVPVLQRLMA